MIETVTAAAVGGVLPRRGGIVSSGRRGASGRCIALRRRGVRAGCAAEGGEKKRMKRSHLISMKDDYFSTFSAHRPTTAVSLFILLLLTACIPPARLPAPPLNPPGLLPVTEPGAKLAMQLAPTLFVQRDEPFPLIRVAAVVHPRRPIIAYHLLCEHEGNLQWVPLAHTRDAEAA